MAIRKEEYWQFSCYKIMFFMGIWDLFQVGLIGIITGIMTINGSHFCTNPVWYYIVGCLASCKISFSNSQFSYFEILKINFQILAIWYAASLVCFFLALNRLFEICTPFVAKILFDGRRIYVWLLISIVYFLFSLADAPFLFCSRHFAYHPDPYNAIEGMEGNPVVRKD